MKTISLPSAIGPSVILTGLMAVAVLVIALTGLKVPLLSNPRISLVVFLILGMAMCTSGIGRVGATNQWTHPLSILGYALGALILVLAAVAFFDGRLLFIANGRQAFVAVAILTGAKVLNSVLHALIR